MVAKFRKRFSDKSMRRPGYDYSNPGAYFITLVTKNRVKYFGKPVQGIMQLSEIGSVACRHWLKIPEHFANVELGSFIIMPDHIHGIIIKRKDPEVSPNLGDPSPIPNWQPGALGVIINQFKRISTIKSRKINPEFAWQSRYHDRIIRNMGEYNRISKYILDNPGKW